MSVSGWSRRRRAVVAATAVAVVGVGVWGVKVVRVLQSVDAYAEHWSTPRGDEGGLVYVALGDSAAQGVGASAPEAGYVGLVADAVRDATGLPVRIVNLSSSGARVRDVVEQQLPRLEGMCADLITVGVGGNDVRDYDPAGFARDVAALAQGLPAGTVIADVPYFMHGRWQEHAEQARDVVWQEAQAHDLVVAGVQEAMHDRGWSAMLTDYAADWFHPNDRGHRVWASAFWAAVRPLTDSIEPRC